MSYAFAVARGANQNASPSQRAPVLEPPLNHVPLLSKNAVFIDLRVVKQNVDVSERNDFLLKDLKVEIDHIYDIYPEPESMLLRVVFFTEEQYNLYLGRLTAGVPWTACNGATVYGWAPGDAVTNVRFTGVPADLPDDAIRAHFQQFGRVTRFYRSKDKVFVRAANGVIHLSIAVAPGFTLPSFVTLVTPDGTPDKRAYVYTDDFKRRCSRCGTAGHVAQFCRQGRRAPGADAALWSILPIPEALLPLPPPPPTAPQAKGG